MHRPFFMRALLVLAVASGIPILANIGAVGAPAAAVAVASTARAGAATPADGAAHALPAALHGPIGRASGILVGTASDDATSPTTAPVTPTNPTTPGTTPGTTPVPDGLGDTTKLKGFIPNDHVGVIPWTQLQWNFIGPYGVGASVAWQQLRDHGAHNDIGRGTVVAVVDSGVAYRTRGRYVQSPDLPPGSVLKGWDFVDNDRFPDDLSGHGTHVASTIAARVNNDAGLTGLAYDAKILPVRVLNADDEGDVFSIARGIRYATRKGAKIINLSVDFPPGLQPSDLPEVMSAVKAAYKAGVLVVSSAGNEGRNRVSLPARSRYVLSVGATTADGCRAAYSNSGPDLDLVAPGGGKDHRDPSDARCVPNQPGPSIAQITLLQQNDPSSLGLPLDYIGTSMAAAHVSGVAALVRSSGILGKNPSPALMIAFLEQTARDLGKRGRDNQYGYGLVDAAAATNVKTVGPARTRARAIVAAQARKAAR